MRRGLHVNVEHVHCAARTHAYAVPSNAFCAHEVAHMSRVRYVLFVHQDHWPRTCANDWSQPSSAKLLITLPPD